MRIIAACSSHHVHTQTCNRFVGIDNFEFNCHRDPCCWLHTHTKSAAQTVATCLDVLFRFRRTMPKKNLRCLPLPNFIVYETRRGNFFFRCFLGRQRFSISFVKKSAERNQTQKKFRKKHFMNRKLSPLLFFRLCAIYWFPFVNKHSDNKRSWMNFRGHLNRI